MINNFDKIKNLLSFSDDKDTFYHCQIIKRKKENPDLGSDSDVIKTYYISSLKYLDSKMEQIIHLCYTNNARAYINLNKRSYKEIAFEMNFEMAKILKDGNYDKCRRIFDSMCGSFTSEIAVDEFSEVPENTRGRGIAVKKSSITWLIDVDVKDKDFLDKIASDLFNCDPKSTDKVKAIIETKNGFHFITRTFNRQQFKTINPTVEIHYDNPTIIYLP